MPIPRKLSLIYKQILLVHCAEQSKS